MFFSNRIRGYSRQKRVYVKKRRLACYAVPKAGYFLEVQKKSFQYFLNQGLINEFKLYKHLRPLSPYNRFELILQAKHYRLVQPKRTIQQCILKRCTFSAPLFIPVQVVDHKLNLSWTYWFKLADLPLMTQNGHFIINGTPRVILNQVLRSPGVHFTKNVKSNGKSVYNADFIAQRGTWLRLEINEKEKRIWAKFNVKERDSGKKRKLKLPIMPFLLCFGILPKTLNMYLNCFQRFQAENPLPTVLNKDHIWLTNSSVTSKLSLTAYDQLRVTRFNPKLYDAVKTGQMFDFFPTESIAFAANEWEEFEEAETAFDQDFDLKNKLNHFVGSMPAVSEKTTSTLFSKYYYVLVYSRLLRSRFWNPKHYNLSLAGRTRLNQKLGLRVAFDKTTLTGSDILFGCFYLLQCLSDNQNLSDIDDLQNRQVRPVSELLQSQLALGLMQLQKKATVFGARSQILFANTAHYTPFQKNRAFEYALKYKSKTKPNVVYTRTFFDQFSYKKTQSAMHNMTYTDLFVNKMKAPGFQRRKGGENFSVQTLAGKYKKVVINLFKSALSAKWINQSFQQFFNTHPLSQFLDETNALSELTHKRRLSSLGPGGVSRETAGMDIRGIHPTHYGRICPIETPEGQNAGLVNSLTSHGLVNSSGGIETPFYISHKGHVLKQSPMVFSSQQEKGLILGPGDLSQSKFNCLVNTLLPARQHREYKKVARGNIDYVSTTPIQMISVATSLIPFLEHNDGNRALMGSNMQRQAVATLQPCRPIVTTGFEAKAVADVGSMLQCRSAGIVGYVDSQHIRIYEKPLPNKPRVLQLSTKNNLRKTLPDSTKSSANQGQQIRGVFGLNPVEEMRKTLVGKQTWLKLNLTQHNQIFYNSFYNQELSIYYCLLALAPQIRKSLDWSSVCLLQHVTSLSVALTYASLSLKKMAQYCDFRPKSQLVFKQPFSSLPPPKRGEGEEPLLGEQGKTGFPTASFKLQNPDKNSLTFVAAQNNGSKNLLVKQTPVWKTVKFSDDYLHPSFVVSNASFHCDGNKPLYGYYDPLLKTTQHYYNAGKVFIGRFSHIWHQRWVSDSAKQILAHEKKASNFHQKIYQSRFSVCFDNGFSFTKQKKNKLANKSGPGFVYKSFLNPFFGISQTNQAFVPNQTLVAKTYKLNGIFRSNQDTYRIHRACVQPGQWIPKGGLLADNASSSQGELAVGQNLLVGYTPWQGYNFEDAILINQKLALDDTLTSLHIERFSVDVKDTQFGFEKITNKLPGRSLDRSVFDLNSNGVVKVGTWVHKGSILVGKVTPVRGEIGNYEILLARVLTEHRDFQNVRETSLCLPHGSGRVIHVEIQTNYGRVSRLTHIKKKKSKAEEKQRKAEEKQRKAEEKQRKEEEKQSKAEQEQETQQRKATMKKRQAKKQQSKVKQNQSKAKEKQNKSKDKQNKAKGKQIKAKDKQSKAKDKQSKAKEKQSKTVKSENTTNPSPPKAVLPPPKKRGEGKGGGSKKPSKEKQRHSEAKKRPVKNQPKRVKKKDVKRNKVEKKVLLQKPSQNAKQIVGKTKVEKKQIKTNKVKKKQPYFYQPQNVAKKNGLSKKVLAPQLVQKAGPKLLKNTKKLTGNKKLKTKLYKPEFASTLSFNFHTKLRVKASTLPHKAALLPPKKKGDGGGGEKRKPSALSGFESFFNNKKLHKVVFKTASFNSLTRLKQNQTGLNNQYLISTWQTRLNVATLKRLKLLRKLKRNWLKNKRRIRFFKLKQKEHSFFLRWKILRPALIKLFHHFQNRAKVLVDFLEKDNRKSQLTTLNYPVLKKWLNQWHNREIKRFHRKRFQSFMHQVNHDMQHRTLPLEKLDLAVQLKPTTEMLVSQFPCQKFLELKRLNVWQKSGLFSPYGNVKNFFFEKASSFSKFQKCSQWAFDVHHSVYNQINTNGVIGTSVKRHLSANANVKPLCKGPNPNHISRVYIYVAQKHKIQVGDKLSGRHGNKGIVSRLLPCQDMPYLPDGTPLDLVLNPLGVPSRMNVGQIFECLLGLAGSYLHQNYKIQPFDEIYGCEASRSLVYSKLYEARLKTQQDWLFDPNFPGKVRLFDGRTGQCFDQPVTVGKAYILKLIHMVDEKIHAREKGPYSLITQQPLRGRAKMGGQRVGEMEVWALEGFGASYALHEILTFKSDDIFGRARLFNSMYYDKKFVPGTPESFKVLVRELRALCFETRVYKENTPYGPLASPWFAKADQMHGKVDNKKKKKKRTLLEMLPFLKRRTESQRRFYLESLIPDDETVAPPAAAPINLKKA